MEFSNAACQTSVELKIPTTTSSAQTEELEQDIGDCTRENCFCAKSQAKAQQTKSSSRWRSLFRGVLVMVVMFLSFTFLGGIEIDGDVYYPVTWYSLR